VTNTVSNTVVQTNVRAT